MTSVWLALNYLRARPLLNSLTALAVALAISIVVATTTLSNAVRQSAADTAGGYRLLLAAKGSQIQAVLSTLFFAEAPTGNIPYEIYERVRADEGVELAVPFNFGDSYKSHLIVGTTPDYLRLLGRSPQASDHSGVRGAWPKQAFEAILGASVSRQTGLEIGDRFTAAHGFVEVPADLARHHEAQPYTVVGVLEETGAPADRAIFTTLDTSWLIHDAGHGTSSNPRETAMPDQADETAHREITAVLVQGRGYGDVSRLNAMMAQRGDVQAIFPGRVATQVLGYLQRGQSLVTAIAWLATGIACLGIMISLFAAAVERRRQIATLRAIGASRATVLGVMAVEGVVTAGVGAIVGLGLGWLMAAAIALQLEQSGYQLDLGQAGTAEIFAVLIAMGLGLLAGSIPALLALREDVAKGLSAMT